MKELGQGRSLGGTPHVTGDEGELCGGIPTVDVRDERYEVVDLVNVGLVTNY